VRELGTNYEERRKERGKRFLLLSGREGSLEARRKKTSLSTNLKKQWKRVGVPAKWTNVVGVCWLLVVGLWVCVCVGGGWVVGGVGKGVELGGRVLSLSFWGVLWGGWVQVQGGFFPQVMGQGPVGWDHRHVQESRGRCEGKNWVTKKKKTEKHGRADAARTKIVFS